MPSGIGSDAPSRPPCRRPSPTSRNAHDLGCSRSPAGPVTAQVGAHDRKVLQPTQAPPDVRLRLGIGVAEVEANQPGAVLARASPVGLPLRHCAGERPLPGDRCYRRSSRSRRDFRPGASAPVVVPVASEPPDGRFAILKKKTYAPDVARCGIGRRPRRLCRRAARPVSGPARIRRFRPWLFLADRARSSRFAAHARRLRLGSTILRGLRRSRRQCG
jgi:hypothetical protein